MKNKKQKEKAIEKIDRKQMKKEVMTRKHKDWKKFLCLLDGPEGINFRGDDTKPETWHWKCKAGNDKSLTKKILRKYFPDVDIEKSLEYFEDRNGGHCCDCEILFNLT